MCVLNGEIEPPTPLSDAEVVEAQTLADRIASGALGTARSAAEVLRAVLELIGDERRWFARPPSGVRTEDYAFTNDGQSTWWGDPEACRWCVGGAVFLVGRAPASQAPSPRPEWPATDRFDDTPCDQATIAAQCEADVLLQEELGCQRVHVADHGHAVAALRRGARQRLCGSTARPPTQAAPRSVTRSSRPPRAA